MKVILVGGLYHGKEMEVDEAGMERACWRLNLGEFEPLSLVDSPPIASCTMKIHTYQARILFGKFVRVDDAILFEYVGPY